MRESEPLKSGRIFRYLCAQQHATFLAVRGKDCPETTAVVCREPVENRSACGRIAIFTYTAI